jgi:hypothetical protein
MDTLQHRFVLARRFYRSIVTAFKKMNCLPLLTQAAREEDVLRHFPALGINKHELRSEPSKETFGTRLHMESLR